MAKVNVKFEVTSKGAVTNRWIAVDAEDVALDQNGTGQLPVAAGTATLVWWFLGDEGSSITVIGKAGNRTVVSVTSKVPKSKDRGAGFRDFNV